MFTTSSIERHTPGTHNELRRVCFTVLWTKNSDIFCVLRYLVIILSITKISILCYEILIPRVYLSDRNHNILRSYTDYVLYNTQDSGYVMLLGIYYIFAWINYTLQNMINILLEDKHSALMRIPVPAFPNTNVLNRLIKTNKTRYH